jgi:hypothetical protein
MKYQLETIPIWEAYEAKTECPICFLASKLTKNYTDFFLGGSVMEPDIRESVNAFGFCREHFGLLFEAGNKQSAALMAHTRLLTLGKMLSGKMKKLLGSEVKTKAKTFMPKEKDESRALADFADLAERSSGTCVFCSKLDTTLTRYVFTIVYLWKKNPDFRKELGASKGFCIPHMAPVIRMADSVLSRTHRNQFISGLFTLEESNLNRVEEEILWYTQKFDQQNKDKPWKNSADALPRTVQKLVGKV